MKKSKQIAIRIASALASLLVVASGIVSSTVTTQAAAGDRKLWYVGDYLSTLNGYGSLRIGTQWGIKPTIIVSKNNKQYSTKWGNCPPNITDANFIPIKASYENVYYYTGWTVDDNHSNFAESENGYLKLSWPNGYIDASGDKHDVTIEYEAVSYDGSVSYRNKKGTSCPDWYASQWTPKRGLQGNCILNGNSTYVPTFRVFAEDGAIAVVDDENSDGHCVLGAKATVKVTITISDVSNETFRCTVLDLDTGEGWENPSGYYYNISKTHTLTTGNRTVTGESVTGIKAITSDTYMTPEVSDKYWNKGYDYWGDFTPSATLTRGVFGTEETTKTNIDGKMLMQVKMSGSSAVLYYHSNRWHRSGFSDATIVEYNTNGGTWPDTTTANKYDTVQKGDSFLTLDQPSKEGYVFVGWKDSKGAWWNANGWSSGSKNASSTGSAGVMWNTKDTVNCPKGKPWVWNETYGELKSVTLTAQWVASTTTKTAYIWDYFEVGPGETAEITVGGVGYRYAGSTTGKHTATVNVNSTYNSLELSPDDGDHKEEGYVLNKSRTQSVGSVTSGEWKMYYSQKISNTSSKATNQFLRLYDRDMVTITVNYKCTRGEAMQASTTYTKQRSSSGQFTPPVPDFAYHSSPEAKSVSLGSSQTVTYTYTPVVYTITVNDSCSASNGSASPGWEVLGAGVASASGTCHDAVSLPKTHGTYARHEFVSHASSSQSVYTKSETVANCFRPVEYSVTVQDKCATGNGAATAGWEVLYSVFI